MKNKNITQSDIEDFLKSKYPNGIESKMTEEISTDEWSDLDLEEEGYDSEYDWYIDHSNGVVEDSIISEITQAIERKFGKTISEINSSIGVDTWEIITNIFPILNY